MNIIKNVENIENVKEGFNNYNTRKLNNLESNTTNLVNSYNNSNQHTDKFFVNRSKNIISGELKNENQESFNLEKFEENIDVQNQFLKIVKDISSKGFLRSNYKKKLVDLSDIKINLKDL